MSAPVEIDFVYAVEDINNTVRRTNTLLRAANALRLSIRDIKQLWKEPNLARFMWTLVQLMRTYNAFKRIYRLVFDEANKVFTLSGIFKSITYVPPTVDGPTITPSMFSDLFGDFALTVEANINGFSVPVDALDISDIEEESLTKLQGIFEEEARFTADTAKRLLNQRIGVGIKYPPSRSTGYLETTIGWESRFPGVRVYAHAPYAWWVEEGQRSFPGHHFLKDAAEITRGKLSERIQKEINYLIFKNV